MRRAIGATAAALAALALAGPASAETARIHYMLHCQGCHLADGAGSPGSVPSLRDSIGLFPTVPRGREFLVRVPGSAQSPLSDADLAAVLNWMVRQFGPAEAVADFAPFSADEVSRHRGSPLTDVESLRSELLREIERAGAREDGR